MPKSLFSPLTFLLMVLAIAPHAVAFFQEPDLVRSVEQQRGGRHWIDKATDPPKSAEESLKCFQIEPGHEIHLVAAEPLILDPVAIEFDRLGRMFVAEYADYPVGPKDPSAPRLSRIVLLEDTDNDRRMDRRTVFADNLAFCHSLMALMDGILTCTETEIVYLKDTNGDNAADIREIWYSGFTPAHPQMQIGCPRWGFDNWIYLTYGPGKVRCLRPGFETTDPVTLAGRDFRFHPRTMQFESVTGLGQFGNTIDNEGHRFFSTNRNPIMTAVLPLSVLGRNPLANLATGHTDVGPAGEATRVYPLVDMKSNWLSHAGTHTSACGVTAYRGDLFGPSFQHSVFACEPVGHLVTRSVTEPLGATLTATRAREKADFLASTDTWFRPASLSTGPDGALYLADMYRLWVEHPKFVPDDVAAKMDWRAGEDRGRIWRIVPENQTSFRAVPPTETVEQRVALLRDASSWRRQLGHRLLVEEQQADSASAVRELLGDKTTVGHCRLHAVWVLDGLQKLTAEDLELALADEFAPLRRDAIRLASSQFAENPGIRQLIEGRCMDSSAEVQLEAILAMADSTSPDKGVIIGKAMLKAGSDPWLQAAVLSSCENCSAAILATLVEAWNTEAPETDIAASREELLRKLSYVAAGHGDQTELQQVLALIASGPQSGSGWQTAMLTGVAQGLPRTTDPKHYKSLAALLAAPAAEFADSAARISALMQTAASVAIDGARSEAERLAGIRLLPFQAPAVIAETTSSLFQANQPLSCQIAALDVVRQTGRPDLAMQTLATWDSLRPAVRSQALDLLLARKETISELLNQMSDGKVSPSVVSIDQRLRLLQSADEATRKLATDLFGGTVSANRKQVADQYAEALTIAASAQSGAKIFEKSCSKCHRIDGVGHQVGPDISDTRNRARDALLYDILDPNRRVDPQFTDYVMVTSDGRTFNGLLVSETMDAVVLRQPEAILQTVQRREIEELRSTNRSLMPEGIEKDVTVQQMADLLEFLKSR